jgi:hypothetical protein
MLSGIILPSADGLQRSQTGHTVHSVLHDAVACQLDTLTVHNVRAVRLRLELIARLEVNASTDRRSALNDCTEKWVMTLGMESMDVLLSSW